MAITKAPQRWKPIQAFGRDPRSGGLTDIFSKAVAAPPPSNWLLPYPGPAGALMSNGTYLPSLWTATYFNRGQFKSNFDPAACITWNGNITLRSDGAYPNLFPQSDGVQDADPNPSRIADGNHNIWVEIRNGRPYIILKNMIIKGRVSGGGQNSQTKAQMPGIEVINCQIQPPTAPVPTSTVPENDVSWNTAAGYFGGRTSCRDASGGTVAANAPTIYLIDNFSNVLGLWAAFGPQPGGGSGVRIGVNDVVPDQIGYTGVNYVTTTFTRDAIVTTLAADITQATDTTVTVASGAGINNGDYILCNLESMQVVSGGGTTTLTVTRAQLGTTAPAYQAGPPPKPSHANGTQVSVQTLGLASGAEIQNGDIIKGTNGTGEVMYVLQGGGTNAPIVTRGYNTSKAVLNSSGSTLRGCLKLTGCTWTNAAGPTTSHPTTDYVRYGVDHRDGRIDIACCILSTGWRDVNFYYGGDIYGDTGCFNISNCDVENPGDVFLNGVFSQWHVCDFFHAETNGPNYNSHNLRFAHGSAASHPIAYAIVPGVHGDMMRLKGCDNSALNAITQPFIEWFFYASGCGNSGIWPSQGNPLNSVVLNIGVAHCLFSVNNKACQWGADCTNSALRYSWGDHGGQTGNTDQYFIVEPGLNFVEVRWTDTSPTYDQVLVKSSGLGASSITALAGPPG